MSVQILGADGQPLTAKPPARFQALAGAFGQPYDAADLGNQHMAAWLPPLWSPDGELNMGRDRIVSRMRDVVRNDGWASGAITTLLDNVIGAAFRPVSKPDHRFLAAYSGNKGFDPVWADEFGRAAEARYRGWAEDSACWCDVSRNQTLTQIMYLAFRHYCVDGDGLAILPWLPGRIGAGRAKYATAVHLIDPDRLSNPQLTFDTNIYRGGVEIDSYGAATHYHIRRAHQGDWFDAAESVIWDRIPRETDWGRPIVVHYYNLNRAAQHRGGAGILTPVLQRLKMLIKYDGSELDAAILNAIFGAYVESPFDREIVQDALTASDLPPYQDARQNFHNSRRMMLGESRLSILFPGERINMVTAARPSTNFEPFEAAVLRNVAAGSGLSYEQVSKDWSRTNYSSARASLLEVWKTFSRQRANFAIGFATPIWGAWLEEAFDLGELPLPGGAVPDFLECRAAFARAHWMGPGKGWVDPVKEKQGAILGMEALLSTLEHEGAEAGRNWEEDAEQRALELRRLTDLGLPWPSWATMPVQYSPTEVAGGAP